MFGQIPSHVGLLNSHEPDAFLLPQSSDLHLGVGKVGLIPGK